MLELYNVMKSIKNFLSPLEFHIGNEPKVNETDIELRNQTELNLVGYESTEY